MEINQMSDEGTSTKIHIMPCSEEISCSSGEQQENEDISTLISETALSNIMIDEASIRTVDDSDNRNPEKNIDLNSRNFETAVSNIMIDESSIRTVDDCALESDNIDYTSQNFESAVSNIIIDESSIRTVEDCPNESDYVDSKSKNFEVGSNQVEETLKLDKETSQMDLTDAEKTLSYISSLPVLHANKAEDVEVVQLLGAQQIGIVQMSDDYAKKEIPPNKISAIDSQEIIDISDEEETEENTGSTLETNQLVEKKESKISKKSNTELKQSERQINGPYGSAKLDRDERETNSNRTTEILPQEKKKRNEAKEKRVSKNWNIDIEEEIPIFKLDSAELTKEIEKQLKNSDQGIKTPAKDSESEVGKSEEDVTPQFEINMTKLNQLFQSVGSSNDDAISSQISSEDGYPRDNIISSIKRKVSKTDESFQSQTIQDTNTGECSISSSDSSELEFNLSDFLQFKATPTTSTEEKNGDMAVFYPQFESYEEYSNCTTPTRSLESCDEILSKRVKTDENTLFSQSAELFEGSSIAVQASITKVSENSDEVVVIEDDIDESIYKEYCKWFPYDSSEGPAYRRKKKLDATIFENKNNSRLYRCNICFAFMKEKSELLKHGCLIPENLRGKKLYICKEYKCIFDTYNEYLFYQHQDSHKKEIGHKCSICEFYALNANLIEEHARETHQKGTIMKNKTKCPFCFFESDVQDIIELHIKRRHGRQPKKYNGDASEIYKCERCQFQTNKKLKFDEHISCGKCRKNYKCKYCNYCSGSKKFLIQHLKHIHNLRVNVR